MGGYTVYLVGFHDTDLSADEQSKLDEHSTKWGAGWSGDAYKPMDKRDAAFQNVAGTFADEPRADGKHIIIYQEITIDSSEKGKFLEAFNDIKSVCPAAVFEAHDESGKIA
ncbi:MAG: hypothetical protein OEZ36_05545 [Spirochaetota bacterium]|nr:hypothetical protein [Spirochaetota bacterium]